MAPTEETVTLVDERGRVVGEAPRSRMRAENLRHAATGVLLRDPPGRIYVHRRSPAKDGTGSHRADGRPVPGTTLAELAPERKLSCLFLFAPVSADLDPDSHGFLLAGLARSWQATII